MESKHLEVNPLQLFGVLIVLICAFSTAALSQTVNGAFHGTVTDPTGAVIPGVKIVVKNLSNGQLREATTDSHGFYTITQLPPGRYSISASKLGFATAAQANVELLVNEDLQADYTLKVGEVTQRVQVTAALPMLKTASATLGQVIESRETVDLPLNGRQFTQLILLTPGAAPKEGGQQSFYVIPIGGGAISPAVNGQQSTENSFTLDGVLNNHFFYQAAAISPPPDAIQEFNAQYHATDAQFGISSGADVNVVTKSGGPQFHGDAWEFLRNSSLDAANFFDNFAKKSKPPYRQNQYGVTIGGPLILPFYNGKKKQTYFFGYWEGFRSAKAFTEFANVPTTAEENGDFADLLTNTPATGSSGQPLFDNLGRPIVNGQIYNPYSTRQVSAGALDPVTGLTATSSGLVRDPFPGNIIPSGMLTPQALTYLHAFYPAPNFGPGGSSFPNLAATSDQDVSSDQFGFGLDHTFSNNDTLFGKFYFSQPDETFPNPLLLGTTLAENHARMTALGYTHIFSPTLVASAHYGYSWLYSQFSQEPAGTALLEATNLQPALVEQNGYPLVPQISLAPRLNGTKQFAISQGPMRTHQLNVDIRDIHGSHTLGVGLLYMHIHAFDNGWGATIAFDQYPSSGISQSNTNEPTTGDGLASMLLNLPSNLTESAGITSADIEQNWIGGYAQDKWQASRKLSLTVGLRWDFSSPPHYRSNEFSAWNADCPTGHFNTPAAIQATEEACILMPVPYVVLPTSSNPNPLSWPLPNVRSTIFDPRYDGWQPRFGFAYAVKPRMVIRGGFVIFDDHNQFDKQTQGARGSWPFAVQSGGGPLLRSLNRGIPSVDFNALPSASSFLTGSQPIESVADDTRAKIPYSMEYNFGFQRQIASNLAITVNYVGSQSRHLWGIYAYNQPLPSRMGPNAFPDGLPFPFLGTVLGGEANFYNSNYNSLEVKVQKRYSRGLSFLASYTYSRCLDENSGDYATEPQNIYDIAAERGPCDYNFPQLFSFNTVYQLPFGQGKHFASNVGRGLDALIGGWNISDITMAHNGSPFTAGLAFDNANAGTSQRANVVPGCQLLPPSFRQNVFHWYNPACFTIPAPYTFGDLGRNTLRGPNYLDFDIALYKDFKLTESKTLQFRVDTFNVFNRPNFSPPGGGATGSYAALGGSTATDVATPTFMQILNAAPARDIQFALKFLF